jgi:integrase
MRPAEGLRVQWPDINTRQRTVDVDATKTEDRRIVDLSPRLADALASWQASCEAEALMRNRAPSAWVFGSRAGQPLEVNPISRRFRALLRRASLPRCRLYDLRHTYATQLLDTGAPLTDVAKQLGHKKPTTTLQFYAHWMPRDTTPYLDRSMAARNAPGGVRSW